MQDVKDIVSSETIPEGCHRRVKIRMKDVSVIKTPRTPSEADLQ